MKVLKIFTVVMIASLILIADQLSKYIVSKNFQLNHPVPVIKNIFYITLVKNQGIAFGIFQQNLFFMLFTAILIIVLLVLSKRFIAHFYSRIGFTLLFAGASGNFIDRIRLGYIIDFLDFRVWPVFNLSDISICIGVVFLCVQFCLK